MQDYTDYLETSFSISFLNLPLNITLEKAAMYLLPDFIKNYVAIFIPKLLQIMTVAEIAEETGTSRNTVYKALKMLRTIFADSNLQDYLSS